MEDLKYLKTEIENLKKIRMEEPNEWRVEGVRKNRMIWRNSDKKYDYFGFKEFRRKRKKLRNFKII